MNPDEAINVEGAVEDQTEAFAYSAYEERAARIPSDESGQVYELRRMFRLWFINGDWGLVLPYGSESLRWVAPASM
jgi:hypothetical protein